MYITPEKKIYFQKGEGEIIQENMHPVNLFNLKFA